MFSVTLTLLLFIVPCYCQTVGDKKIDSGVSRNLQRGGANFVKNLYKAQLAIAIEGSGPGGLLPRKFLKSKASNDALLVFLLLGP